MKTEKLKQNIQLAKSLAAETFGENPPPEIVAAVLNAITAQGISDDLEELGRTIGASAAVASGS